MNAREELASVIERAYNLNEGMVTFELLAQVILAAGYTKPSQATTVMDLQVLPAKSTILDCAGTPWVNDGDMAQPWASLCEDAQGGPIWSDSDEISLPATVLYSPEDAA